MNRPVWTTNSVLQRDPRVLAPRFQWEFTRRHPYYIKNWERANRYHEAHATGQWDLLDQATRQELADAWHLLSKLNAVGPNLPDPAIDGREQADFVPPFTRPAAKALTYRVWIEVLLLQLPERVRNIIAHSYLKQLAKETVLTDWQKQLQAQAKDIVAKVPQKEEDELFSLAHDGPLPERLISELHQLGLPELDNELPGFLFVDVYAPKEKIVEEVMAHVTQCRDEGNIPERRRRADKYDTYLKAWDLMEGFSDGAYQGDRELRLADVCQRLVKSRATVQSCRKKAFEMITGHQYDPNLWATLFLAAKFSKSKWKNWRRSKPRSVSGTQDTTVPLTYDPGTTTDDLAQTERILDIRSLLDKDRSDQQISVELEVPVDLVQFVRESKSDGLID